MSLFHSILSKVSSRLGAEERRMTDIAAIVTKDAGIVVKESELSLHKGVLYIKVSPTIKLAVMIKKEMILASCKERGIAVHAIA